MYLRSIKNLDKEIKETALYKEKRPTSKPVLIDRCNYLLNSIISINRKKFKEQTGKYKPVPLNSRQLKEVLGRNYIDIVKALKSLGYIKVNSSYLSKATLQATNNNRRKYGKKKVKSKVSSKTYSLTPKALSQDIAKVGVISERIEGKINAYRKKTFKEYLENPMHRKIINSTMQVNFNSENKEAIEATKQYEENTAKGQFYNETFTELEEINNYTTTSEYIDNTNYYYMQSQKVDRVYHYYTTIPKAYRQP